MIPFIELFSSVKVKIAAVVIIALVAFIAGWKINGWRHDAQLKRSLEEVMKQAQIQAKQDRQTIAQLQAKKQEVVTREVIRHAQIKNVTDDRVCFANWDAIRLWNDALSGQESMSKNTTGTTNSTGNASATDTEILENLNTNAARWERLREQMNAIIEWDKQTFGERDK